MIFQSVVSSYRLANCILRVLKTLVVNFLNAIFDVDAGLISICGDGGRPAGYELDKLLHSVDWRASHVGQYFSTPPGARLSPGTRSALGVEGGAGDRDADLVLFAGAPEGGAVVLPHCIQHVAHMAGQCARYALIQPGNKMQQVEVTGWLKSVIYGRSFKETGQVEIKPRQGI